MPGQVLSLWGAPETASGREAELSMLVREREEARAQSRARFVFIRGPAGVGKSHLFMLCRQALAGRGADIFEADSPRDTKRPFGLFAPLLGQLLEHLGHLGVPGAQLAELSGRLAPLFGHRPQAVSDEARLDLFDAAGEVITLAGRSAPVFLFSDLDAADLASLEMFRYLAAVVSAPTSRACGLFAASFRDEGPLPAPLSEVMGKLSARTVSLGGLDLEGIRGFLARPEVAQRLFESTGGLPDALEELIARPLAKPVELFLRRAAQLPSRARDVLSVLACARQGVTAQTVAQALRGARGEQDVAGCAAELDSLTRQHLVCVKMVSDRPVYRFARDSERTAWASELGPELAPFKGALGRALQAAGELAPAAELLLEVDPDGEGGRAAVVAAQALADRGACEEAMGFYARALPHLPRGEQPGVHRRLAELAEAQGDWRTSLAHLARVRTPRGQERTALFNAAAGCLMRLGRLSKAERLLEAALARGSSPEAMVNQVELRLLQNRLDEATRLANAGLPSLAGFPEQAIAVRNALGRVHLLRGDLEAAEASFAANHALAAQSNLSALAGEAMINLGVTAHKRGDRECAIRCYMAGSSGVRRPAQARALANLGSIYAESGDFEPALDHLSRALQAFSRLGSQRDAAQAASNLARLHHFLGELERALELSEHSLKIAREVGEPYLIASALLNLGAVLLEKKDLHQAVRLLDEARARFEEVGNQGYAAYAIALKARAHLALGERAQASVEMARRVLDKGGAELAAAQVEAELVRGELSLGLADLLGAGHAATRARDALLSQTDLEGPYRVYFLSARLRLAAGDASGAQADMSRAARLLDELTQRVPPARRAAFLSLSRRAEVLAASEPDLRLPKLALSGPRPDSAHGLVGRSPALIRITRQLEPIARSNATVLIRGESGTGKEVLAQAIHDLSPRRSMSIIKVNCAAMVEELLLSELFGHEKGAFTGAIRERKGRFELADGGTLFLDEIGDISPKCQVALLRVLQERELERVGGTKTIKVDVRVICATNRDLEALIEQGRFRQDLYYRLKGVMLELPSLRERPEDLPLLAQHILARLARERGETERQLSPDTLQLLARYSWPGNVRELENVLASATIFADGTVIRPESVAHIQELAALATTDISAPVLTLTRPLPEPGSDGGGSQDVDYYELARRRSLSLKDMRHEMEMQCIKRALSDAGGNISEAARLLKMKRSRLSQIVNAEPELRGACHGD